MGGGGPGGGYPASGGGGGLGGGLPMQIPGSMARAGSIRGRAAEGGSSHLVAAGGAAGSGSVSSSLQVWVVLVWAVCAEGVFGEVEP